MESIVTSLEWSKKLKEAGWPQNSDLFFWFYRRNCDDWKIVDSDTCDRWKDLDPFAEYFAAPTAEEILRRLPVEITKRDDNRMRCPLLCAPEHGGSWTVWYDRDYGTAKNEDSLADAAAAMWVYLKENSLLPND